MMALSSATNWSQLPDTIVNARDRVRAWSARFGCVAFWLPCPRWYRGGLKVHDLSGRGRDGMRAGTGAVLPAWGPRGLTFASTCAVSCGAFDPSAAGLTLECLHLPAASSATTQVLIAKRAAWSSGQDRWTFTYSASRVYLSSRLDLFCFIAYDPPLNKPLHLVVTNPGAVGTAIFYADGSILGTAGACAYDSNVTAPVYLGNNLADGYDQELQGTITLARIYDRVLPQRIIAELAADPFYMLRVPTRRFVFIGALAAGGLLFKGTSLGNDRPLRGLIHVA